MTYVVVTPPAESCVSLDEAKAHLRVDHSDDDELIQALIDGAQAGFESSDVGNLNRPVAKQVIAVKVDCFRTGHPYRIYGPVDEGTEESPATFVITYRDSAGDELSFVETSYEVRDADTLNPMVYLTSGNSWPTGDDARITYTAGYEPDDPRIQNFKMAVKLQVQLNYDGPDDPQRFKDVINSLLSTYRIFSI